MTQPVVAINLFSMLPGVDPVEFEHFSNTVDRPTCLAHHDVVRGFDAYRIVQAPDGAPADVLEVMHVTDWSTWEQIRDTDPSMRPVMDGFNELVDPASVRTYFTRPILGDKQ
ncbi:MAG TPA: hypothetical protein VGO30_08035 [Mycobacterium sp.]|jgi:hypothetical protein|nr:hypothetical protein [Mycobacterium sp.]